MITPTARPIWCALTGMRRRGGGANDRAPYNENPPRRIAALCLAATFVVVTMLPAATGDTIADRELGEPDFLHSAAVKVNGVTNANGNGYGLSGVTALAIDSDGHLYAADTANNRVLGWHDEAALVTGQPADLVVGQVDLYSVLSNGNGGPNVNPYNLSSPSGVAVDSKGNLYVSDTGNGRVLEYNAPYVACGGMLPCSVGPPNLVFGQLNDFFAWRLQLRRVHRRHQRRFSMRSGGDRGR